MLELHDIVKKYPTGDTEVTALGGVSLKFRKNEFVSVLGASGCGKTTLLNIIGGLDRYTSGDLIIGGISTKKYRDRDWDTYRNHSVGFVFQSYNLIPHQTVLSNVELALTLSGVSKHERRERAKQALEKVGLGDQLNKKPSQMSGGQMQRVAIARALVNDPEILLADEPTGALDTTTSVQIMELLKEVAKDRLVIMVTHNPELAAEYSTRIVRLSDGLVIDDTDPYDGEAPVTEIEVTAEQEELTSEEAAAEKETKKEKKAKKNTSKGKKKKTSMSFFTAISLSTKNLMTKKTRTALTSFAGSIGIIGIALILSLSNGIQAYIDRVQEDTLSTYPLSIQQNTANTSAMLEAMTQVSEIDPDKIDKNKIYVDDSMGTMISAMTNTVSNDLVSFKQHVDKNYADIEDYVSDVQYTYNFKLQVYSADGKTQVSPSTVFDNLGPALPGIGDLMTSMGGINVMSEMIGNQELLNSQYELVGNKGHWPKNANEVVLVVNKNNQISKMTLYMLGVLPQDEIPEVMGNIMNGEEYNSIHMKEYSLDDFLGMKFKLFNASDFYEKTNSTYDYEGKKYPVWKEMKLNDDMRAAYVTENGEELVISGIVRPKEDATASSISTPIGYTKELTEKILEMNKNSEILLQQKATPTKNVLSGMTFERTIYTAENIDELIALVDDSTMELFYASMTSMIMQDPELASRLVVTENNFSQMFFLLNEEDQIKYLDLMLKASENNSMLDTALFPAISAMFTKEDGSTANITVNKDNLLTLFKIMSMEQKYVLISGISTEQPIPMTVPGLQAMSGDAMKDIYTSATADIKQLKIDENLFKLMLPQLSEKEFALIEQTLYDTLDDEDKDATLESTLTLLGDSDKASPASINFYAKDFEAKDNIEEFIADYNKGLKKDEKSKEIKYSDLIGTMMSSISLIINVISYVLIAFVSISLIVSSIMIGIITYISVLERTKEIGILRAIGASKKDISRVFNAETLIMGFTAGLFGIIATVVLCIPINHVIHALSGISTINAVLPWLGGIALVLISMVLTFIAGLIPSRIASKKDPVEALRSE